MTTDQSLSSIFAAGLAEQHELTKRQGSILNDLVGLITKHLARRETLSQLLVLASLR